MSSPAVETTTPVAEALRYARPGRRQAFAGLGFELRGFLRNVRFGGFTTDDAPAKVVIFTRRRRATDEAGPCWAVHELYDGKGRLGTATVVAAGTAGEAVRRFVLTAAAYAGGFLPLHAAAVVGKEGALVFAGRSGAGKTTATALLREQPPVHDDLSVLDARRQDAPPMLLGSRLFSPYHEPATADRLPVAGIFLLRQARRCALRELSPARAAARLTPARPEGLPPKAAEQLLDTALRAAEQIPCLELSFNLNTAELRRTLRPWLAGES